MSVVHERGRGIAWRIWPGAHVLLDWLEKNVGEWRSSSPCHCVEIGAGVGLVGIVCAGLGAERVTLTDLPEELEALKRSVACNHHESVRNKVHVMPLSFGNDEEIDRVVGQHHKQQENLVVVGSELIYWESLFEPIAKTLNRLILNHSGVALIGYRKRVWKTEKRFFTKVLKQYGLDCIVVGQWMAVEEDGASQTTDGQVMYTDASSFIAGMEPEWNTRVYKIFPSNQTRVGNTTQRDVEDLSPKHETPKHVSQPEGKEEEIHSPQIAVSPPSKDKKKHKIVHKERKGRVR